MTLDQATVRQPLSRTAQLAVPKVTGESFPSLATARVALVHYWLVSQRGGENVLEVMANMFPQADLFCLVVNPDAIPPSLCGRSITTSFLQKLPGSHRWHKRLLPFYPLALEQFDLGGYDLVISAEAGPTKGVLTSSRTCHVCYCHSPMRYLWDFYHRYKSDAIMGPLSRPLFALATHYLRLWDVASANRVDYFAANSQFVASRIRKHYRREATVVYPPVKTRSGYLSGKTEDFYLIAGQLVDYKRVDLAISACNRLARKLHVVGEGEQYARLRSLAGPTVHFCGPLSDKDLHEQYAHCRALLFPGEEDFGAVPVEALSFGRPVIAYARGGALETVLGFRPGPGALPENSSGVFFPEQTSESLVEAILAFEEVEHRFRPLFIKQQADRFAPERFQQNFALFLAQKLEEFHNEPSRL